MVKVKSLKNLIISQGTEFLYVFLKDEIRDVPEEHLEKLLSTGKIIEVK